ncbi:DUF6506 family protein [Desulfofundulus thermosubterraneus]|uniref:Electron transfer flavoprotein domain-containing protein n=1 Tax=Desulfofundulus thermosubterraneus DSM 16057 TaxID=1121432 RepID=A0A1M6GL26_9FIRM|nr:DUF6506 family protein [Desulfofundulus thermosubterraneus]SHJ10634.1 hypothetical protein SAMN02745219_01773 [Desulfofundulus thermosubterraneus DSM 16057]
MLKAAFIFVAPEADPARHRAVVKTPEVELTVVGVKDYTQAEETARELVAAGTAAIELCGGFGHDGAARVARAAGESVSVGVVRFDLHPGLGGRSGDRMFG